VLLIVVDIVVWSIGVLLAYQSISTLLVMRHAANRHLPTPSEWRGAITGGIGLLVVIVLLMLRIVGGPGYGYALAIVTAMLLPAAVASARCLAPRRRWGLAILTIGLAVLGLWQPAWRAIDPLRTQTMPFNSDWPLVIFGVAFALATPVYLYRYDAKSED
jgi:hypothetical protein